MDKAASEAFALADLALTHGRVLPAGSRMGAFLSPFFLSFFLASVVLGLLLLCPFRPLPSPSFLLCFRPNRANP